MEKEEENKDHKEEQISLKEVLMERATEDEAPASDRPPVCRLCRQVHRRVSASGSDKR